MSATSTTVVAETTSATLQSRRSFFLRPPKDELPVSDPGSNPKPFLRRRLSSISGRLPSPSAFGAKPAYSGLILWAWWGLAVGWLLSLRPSFARDLDMDDEEAAALGLHTQGTWRHLLLRLRRLGGGSCN